MRKTAVGPGELLIVEHSVRSLPKTRKPGAAELKINKALSHYMPKYLQQGMEFAVCSLKSSTRLEFPLNLAATQIAKCQ